MATRKTTTAAAARIPLECLGITNPEERESAMGQTLQTLVELINTDLDEQVALGRQLAALVDIAREKLPYAIDHESAKMQAVLGAVPALVTRMDDIVCTFGAYYEALIARAQESEASHG